MNTKVLKAICMKHFNSASPGLTARFLAVIFTVLAILVVSFCASVMAVIYMHADEKGLVPTAFSLSSQMSRPVITIFPREPSRAEEQTPKAPKYQI